MSSQGGPDSQAHKFLFAGGLRFSDGTLADDVINDLPARLPYLAALSASILARARGHDDDHRAALHSAPDSAQELVQVDDRGLPVHMDVDEDASPSGG